MRIQPPGPAAAGCFVCLSVFTHLCFPSLNSLFGAVHLLIILSADRAEKEGKRDDDLELVSGLRGSLKTSASRLAMAG